MDYNSEIQIYSGMKLTKGSEDTLYFPNVSSQNTYFDGKAKVYSALDYAYIRENTTIRVNAPYSQVMNANYLRFRNVSYGNKWIYAFVDKINYISDKCSEIVYTIDDLQTWLPNEDYDLTECRIIRQHQMGSDNIGDNTVAEDVEIGDIHYEGLAFQRRYSPYFSGVDYTATNYYTILLVSYLSIDDQLITPIPTTKNIDGTNCDFAILVFDNANVIDRMNLHTLLSTRNDIKEQSILALYTVSKDTLDETDITDRTHITEEAIEDDGTYSYKVSYIQHVEPLVIRSLRDGARSKVHTWEPNDHLGVLVDNKGVAHTPKNKKLLTAPFCYYNVLSCDGKQMNVDYARLTTLQLKFNICSTLIPPVQVTMFPQNYKETNVSTDTTLAFPSLYTGLYSNTQREKIQDQLLNSIVPTAITIAGGLAGGIVSGGATIPLSVASAASAGASGISQISNTLKSEFTSQHSDITSANLAVANKFFYVQGRSAYPENWEYIDNYFSAYGYMQNLMAVPNISGRQRWTYIKTADASFSPKSIPSDAMKRINDKFNSGIRFHKNEITIGHLTNYENSIL